HCSLAVALEGRLAQVSMDKEDGHCSLAVALEGRLAQVSMDKLNGHRPLADAGGDTLDGTVPHISGGKDTGDAGLQEERFAVKRPVLWRLSIAHQVGAGANKAPLVALYHALQPTCMGLRANEDEQRGCRERLFLVRFVIDDGDAF